MRIETVTAVISEIFHIDGIGYTSANDFLILPNEVTWLGDETLEYVRYYPTLNTVTVQTSLGEYQRDVSDIGALSRAIVKAETLLGNLQATN